MHKHVNGHVTCRLREHLLRDLIEQMHNHQARLDVPAVMFRPSQQIELDAAPDLGWGRHLSSLQIINLPRRPPYRHQAGKHRHALQRFHLRNGCPAATAARGDLVTALTTTSATMLSSSAAVPTLRSRTTSGKPGSSFAMVVPDSVK